MATENSEPVEVQQPDRPSRENQNLQAGREPAAPKKKTGGRLLTGGILIGLLVGFAAGYFAHKVSSPIPDQEPRFQPVVVNERDREYIHVFDTATGNLAGKYTSDGQYRPPLGRSTSAGRPTAAGRRTPFR